MRIAGVPDLVEDRRSQPGRRDNSANARRTLHSTASRFSTGPEHAIADHQLNTSTSLGSRSVISVGPKRSRSRDIVWQMGCTCGEGESLTAGLADVLKPGYETFERPRFERGTCCELLNCLKVGEKHDKPSSIQIAAGASFEEATSLTVPLYPLHSMVLTS
jgi:hypothetical protein